MSKYIVSMLDGVNFAPESEVEEILQNVRTILSTRIGTVPLDRSLGVSWEMIDQPLPIAKIELIQSVIEAIDTYEPRARVESVEFEESTEDAMQGILRPRVIVSLGDEEEDEEVVRDYTRATATAAQAGLSEADLAEVRSAIERAEAAAATASSATAAVSDIDSRLREIEQTDYDAILEGGES